jgi:D-alanyl-D-alanine carboxypeptidase/D-alanyl-D-alanine-endopeptidase (penicillin-binding protein 4)
VIRGAGDPLMDEDDLDIIASAIALRVDTSLTWELVADQSFFDNTRKGKGWMWDDDPYVAPIGPLSVNGNSIDILVRPGLYPGAPTTAELIDTVSGRFALVNLSTTGFSGR